MFERLKIFIFISLLLFFAVTVPGLCQDDVTQEEPVTGKKLIGVVMPVGGLGDLSFAWMAQLGIERINKELYNVEISTLEPSSIDMLKSSFQYYVDNKADLIIGIGFLQEEAIKEVAEKNPDVQFAIIDASVELPNVSSLDFREDEGSFLAGCAAAMVSKTGKVGFIGAMDIELIRKFSNGYEEGAKYINPDIIVEKNYIGEDESSFTSPDKAKEMANKMYESGIDVIFTAAGGSGLGVIDSARILDKYCIGVDSDQDYLAPGNVITSMMKRVDNAIYLFAESYTGGEYEPGKHIVLGLEEGGVSLTEFRYSQKLLTEEQFTQLEEIKKDIISGKIKI